MGERFFPDSMPPPLADSITLPWWEAASEHRLVVQRCTDCEHTRHPPAPVCPEAPPIGAAHKATRTATSIAKASLRMNMKASPR